MSTGESVLRIRLALAVIGYLLVRMDHVEESGATRRLSERPCGRALPGQTGSTANLSRSRSE